jgi:hypothetical protein
MLLIELLRAKKKEFKFLRFLIHAKLPSLHDDDEINEIPGM